MCQLFTIFGPIFSVKQIDKVKPGETLLFIDLTLEMGIDLGQDSGQTKISSPQYTNEEIKIVLAQLHFFISLLKHN